MNDELAWILQAQQGDDEAFTKLVEEHQTHVYNLCYRMLGEPEAAEDAAQETFLRVHRALSTLRDPDAAVAWLYRVATRVCYDRFRQTSNRPALETFEMEPSEPAQVPWSDAEGPRLDKALEQAEMSHCVREYLDELPHDYRTAITLHDLEGIPNPQIAEMLDISVDAVKIHVYRARRKLQDALSGDCDFSFNDDGVFVCEPKPR